MSRGYDHRTLKGEWRDLVQAAVDAGWTPVSRRKGIVLRSPDGVTTTMVHWTYSDHRALKNVRATLRRGGVDV